MRTMKWYTNLTFFLVVISVLVVSMSSEVISVGIGRSAGENDKKESAFEKSNEIDSKSPEKTMASYLESSSFNFDGTGRRKGSKKILQKALWESQSWLTDTLSDSGLRQMTQLFGVDDLLTVPRTKADRKASEGSSTGGTGQTGAGSGASALLKGDTDKPTPEMITDAGYPAEVHEATTEDGYILQMHRIPYGLANGSGPGQGPKTPIYLQHGLLCSSADWVISGPGKGLAYILADKGYDVWMGNVRGNTYSRKHEALDPADAAFWAFSWDEHALFDAPAQMDLITSVTGQKEMFYIGHSMGTVMFWAMSDVQHQYRQRVKAMFALAPVARVDHMLSPVALLAPFVSELKQITDEFGVNEFMPSGRVTSWLKTLFCDPETMTSVDLCQNLIFLLCGFNPSQLNSTLLPAILGHAPAGTSTRNMIHFAQEVNAKRFQHYDFGKDGNLEHYGEPNPPEYDLSKVTTPVITFWGDNDWLAQPKDVQWLTSNLPNLVGNIEVPFPGFNHLDFLWGIDAPQVVYEKILEFLPKFDTRASQGIDDL